MVTHNLGHAGCGRGISAEHWSGLGACTTAAAGILRGAVRTPDADAAAGNAESVRLRYLWAAVLALGRDDSESSPRGCDLDAKGVRSQDLRACLRTSATVL